MHALKKSKLQCRSVVKNLAQWSIFFMMKHDVFEAVKNDFVKTVRGKTAVILKRKRE